MPRTAIKYSYVLIWMFIAFMVVTGLFLFTRKHYEIYTLQKSIHKTYEKQVKTLLPAAIQNLQTNQNDWIICTDLGLSLQNIDDPNAMAAWIAYYQYGKTYCPQWWDWPNNNPCEYMEKQEKYVTNSDKIILLKKIALCKIAKEYKK